MNGLINLAGQRVKVGPELIGNRITARIDGHLLHVVLAKTLPSPFPADERPRLLGACVAAPQLTPPPSGGVSVERRVPRDGVVIVARQRLRVGRTHAGRIVTIYVEDMHFRVTYEGAELSLHARNGQHPVKRWRAKIRAAKI